MIQESPLASATPEVPRIGLLVDTSSSWGRRIIQGVSQYARRHGPWQLFFEARGMEERLRIPPGWHGEGVIARVGNGAMARELRALPFPVVNVSGISLPGEQFPTVTNDLYESARMALDHFVERNFNHFAYFSLRGLSYVATHRKAFANLVRKHGAHCHLYAVKARRGAEPDWNLDLARLGEWLKSLPKPVGILAWSASSGREILYACQVANLLVPEEVAILCSTDDDVLCEHVQPPLSAIFVSAEQIGYHAAALLHRLMRGEPAPDAPTLIAPVNVAVRQSTDTLAIEDPLLVKAMAYIRTHAAQPIQVDDVALAAGTSRRMLERKFLRLLGRSPASEIRNAHYRQACRLLVDTDLPIPDIAEASGFGSPEYFAYSFKAESGKTPLEYRKTIRSR